MPGSPLITVLLFLAAALPGHGARAGEAVVASAANFIEVAERLGERFEDDSGHVLRLAAGSTGALYAQIVNGAPYDVLLAADQARPARLESEGQAVPGSRFTYALGRLTLWSPDPQRIGADGLATLRAGGFDHLAIANPGLAPYGQAARQALEHFGLWEALQPRIVMGQNIGQAFTMVATGNAQLGLVAHSYVISPRNGQDGSFWEVPASAYSPIRQDAVLLQPGADNPAARAFLAFLCSAEARAVIRRFGYGIDEVPGRDRDAALSASDNKSYYHTPARPHTLPEWRNW